MNEGANSTAFLTRQKTNFWSVCICMCESVSFRAHSLVHECVRAYVHVAGNVGVRVSVCIQLLVFRLFFFV